MARKQYVSIVKNNRIQVQHERGRTCVLRKYFSSDERVWQKCHFRYFDNRACLRNEMAEVCKWQPRIIESEKRGERSGHSAVVLPRYFAIGLSFGTCYSTSSRLKYIKHIKLISHYCRKKNAKRELLATYFSYRNLLSNNSVLLLEARDCPISKYLEMPSRARAAALYGALC